jgi:hypothetical protein
MKNPMTDGMLARIPRAFAQEEGGGEVANDDQPFAIAPTISKKKSGDGTHRALGNIPMRRAVLGDRRLEQ